MFGEKTQHTMQILFTENTNHRGNGNQNWQIKNIRIDYKKYGKHNVDVVREKKKLKLNTDFNHFHCSANQTILFFGKPVCWSFPLVSTHALV